MIYRGHVIERVTKQKPPRPKSNPAQTINSMKKRCGCKNEGHYLRA